MNLDWFLPVLKNQYADFSGRTGKQQFWMYILYWVIIAVVLNIVDYILGMRGGVGLSTLFWLGTLIPNIAIGVRRLQDIGKTGLWMLIGLIPLIGLIVLIVFWVQDSEPRENQYGAVSSNNPGGDIMV